MGKKPGWLACLPDRREEKNEEKTTAVAMTKNAGIVLHSTDRTILVQIRPNRRASPRYSHVGVRMTFYSLAFEWRLPHRWSPDRVDQGSKTDVLGMHR